MQIQELLLVLNTVVQWCEKDENNISEEKLKNAVETASNAIYDLDREEELRALFLLPNWFDAICTLSNLMQPIVKWREDLLGLFRMAYLDLWTPVESDDGDRAVGTGRNEYRI